MTEKEVLRKEYYFDKTSRPLALIILLPLSLFLFYIFFLNHEFQALFAGVLALATFFKVLFSPTGKAIIIDIENSYLQLNNIVDKKKGIVIIPFADIKKINIENLNVSRFNIVYGSPSITISTSKKKYKNVPYYGDELINILGKHVPICYGGTELSAKINKFQIEKGLGINTPGKQLLIVFIFLIVMLLFLFLLVEINLYFMR